MCTPSWEGWEGQGHAKSSEPPGSEKKKGIIVRESGKEGMRREGENIRKKRKT